MREVSRHLVVPRLPLMPRCWPERNWFWIAKASLISAFVDLSLGAILDDKALPLAGASQLRFDRQGDGVEIRPLARSFRLQRRGDVRPSQADFDPIGRDGYPLDNF